MSNAQSGWVQSCLATSSISWWGGTACRLDQVCAQRNPTGETLRRRTEAGSPAPRLLRSHAPSIENFLPPWGTFQPFLRTFTRLLGRRNRVVGSLKMGHDASPHQPDAPPHGPDASPHGHLVPPHEPDASPHRPDASPHGHFASPHRPFAAKQRLGVPKLENECPIFGHGFREARGEAPAEP